MQMHFTVKTPKSMQDLGKKLADACLQGTVIFFQGELGAGKTTLIRGFLRRLNYTGNVRSPTFTLLEPYSVGAQQIYHFDLYRLTDAAELEFIGIRDYFNGKAICLVEWPEKGEGYLPQADLIVAITFIPTGRDVELVAQSDKGRKVLDIIRN